MSNMGCPLSDKRARNRLMNSTKDVRVSETRCCVPMMKNVKRVEHAYCGKTSRIGCCQQSQLAPFDKCSDYMIRYSSVEERKEYFNSVANESDDVRFAEVQHVFSLKLYMRMNEDNTQEAANNSVAIAVNETEAYMTRMTQAHNRIEATTVGMTVMAQNVADFSAMCKRKRVLALASASGTEHASSSALQLTTSTRYLRAIAPPSQENAKDGLIKTLREQLDEVTSKTRLLQFENEDLRKSVEFYTKPPEDLTDEKILNILHNGIDETNEDDLPLYIDFLKGQISSFAKVLINIQDDHKVLQNEYKSLHETNLKLREEHSNLLRSIEQLQREIQNGDEDVEMELEDYDELIDAEQRGEDTFDHE